jgi:capsular exopolysaccharide synthesis family protein
LAARREALAEAGGVDPRLVVLTDPASAAAEGFRMLHLRLERIRAGKALGVTALTSAVAGEGKSLTTANLAAWAARRGRRAVVIDGDLRRPKLAELFGLEEGPGLAGLLGGGARVEDAIVPGPAGLAVIPAGGERDPAELLAGAGFRALLDRLRTGYDEVYVDLPPALAFADAAAVAGAADSVIVVVQSGRTPAEIVNQAIELLAGCPLVGCVLTGHDGGAAAYRSYWSRR